MKTILSKSMIISLLFITSYSCSKSNSSLTNTGGNTDNSIQTQIVNSKWYYDSTVYWRADYGFTDLLDYNGNNQKSYLYFGDDSILTEFLWTGVTYNKTEYPYSWSGNTLLSDYYVIKDFDNVQIKDKQLIFGDRSTLPRQTDTTGQVELLWWYYHK